MDIKQTVYLKPSFSKASISKLYLNTKKKIYAGHEIKKYDNFNEICISDEYDTS